MNLLKTIKKYDQETLTDLKKEQIVNQLKVLNHQKNTQLKKQHVQCRFTATFNYSIRKSSYFMLCIKKHLNIDGKGVSNLNKKLMTIY
ncbi:hypothetical protein BTR23_14200 [Alkalihalophilus pseudofirmus]|nr:hypothetical protein BTR23_14200 [Alkalihalophilus pseudofirmus]